MKHSVLVLISCGMLAAAVGGCGTTAGRGASAPPPFPADGGAATWPDSRLQSARALYINKCARCHKFHDPAQYDGAEWNRWMTKMSRKAKLLPEQEQLLRDFLGLYRPAGS